MYFGKNNGFPEKLIEYYNESPTHNAIVNGKVGYICGEGFIYEDPSEMKERKVAKFLKQCKTLKSLGIKSQRSSFSIMKYTTDTQLK